MTELFRVASQEYDPSIDVDTISEHPDNYNHADMGAIEESMLAHGFYGAVLVQRSTRRILAGNHRYREAVELGARNVPGFWLDVDDDEARRMLAVDNHTSMLAKPDESRLIALLQAVQQAPAGLTGTSYTDRALADMISRQDTQPVPLPDHGEPDSSETAAEPITFGVYPQDTVVASAFAHYRQTGLPAPQRLAVHECMQEINQLAALDTPKLIESVLGYATADTYHPHRFDAAVTGKRSIAEVFGKDDYLRHALQLLCTQGTKITDATLRSVLGYLRNAQVASNFRPGFALSLLRRYAFEDAVVLDTSTGYGGRLVGFLASDCGRYIGIDPNTVTHAANLRLAADLGAADRVELHNVPAEDAVLPELCADFAFTSPPYFAKEIYSTEPTQSCARYPQPEAWRDGFLYPTLALQHRALRHGCYAIVNIADVRVGSQVHPLVRWTVDAAKAAGFAHVRSEEFPLGGRVPGRGTKRNASEPVLVFRKPNRQDTDS